MGQPHSVNGRFILGKRSRHRESEKTIERCIVQAYLNKTWHSGFWIRRFFFYFKGAEGVKKGAEEVKKKGAEG